MSKNLYLIILSLFLAALPDAPCQETAINPTEEFSMVNIPGTEMRPFYSAILDRDMLIHIKLPSSYYSNPEKVYSGWYVTDANRSFPLEGAWMLENMEKMADVLKSRNYPGLKLETRTFPDEWHQSCPPTSITRAYRFLYLGN